MNTYNPIIGTLGYVLSADRTQTLMVFRNARPHDVHFHKYNGLGGKMQRDEDVLTCLRREIQEEAGLICDEVFLRGTVNWPGFGPDGADWLGFIFRIDRWRGEPYKANEEGLLSWQAIDRLHELPMWEGDRYFLPLVFDNDPRVFHGLMPYRAGRPVSWSHVRI